MEIFFFVLVVFSENYLIESKRRTACPDNLGMAHFLMLKVASPATVNGFYDLQSYAVIFDDCANI